MKSVIKDNFPQKKTNGKENWVRKDAQRPEGLVVQQFKSFQSNQPIPNPSRDRTKQPVVTTDRSGQPVVGTNARNVQDGRKTSRSQEIDTCSFHEEPVSSDRTGQPVVETSRTPTRSCRESTSFNVGDETLRERLG